MGQKSNKRSAEHRPRTGPLIGINFSDNDFHLTVRAFLGLFIDSRIVECPENVTKTRVVDLFNQIASGLYWITQNGYQYSSDARHMREYLRIEERHVYLGDECVQFIVERSSNCNGEFHYVDVGQRQVFTA